MRERAVFITGATGFVGSNLLNALLHLPIYTGRPVFALARDNARESADKRIRALFPGAPVYAVRGDISEFGLGIDKETLKRLLAFDLEVWHIAGNTAFAENESDEIFKDNLQGTEHLIDFVRIAGVKRLHYMSTAYVAGNRLNLSNGRVDIAYEDELLVGQQLRNPYEESKSQAELCVQKATRALTLDTTIYRISIAVGKHDTGVTTNFTGYYGYMKGFKVLGDKVRQNLNQYAAHGFQVGLDGILHMPIRIWGTPQATINIACIDYLVDIIARLATRSESIGRTFHVVNPKPPKFGWLLETGLAFLKIDGVKVLDPNAPFRMLTDVPIMQNELEEKVNRAIAYYNDYTSGEPRFDDRNVREVLGSVPPHPITDEWLIQALLTYALRVRFRKPSYSTEANA